jgi:hypothetical protein
MMSWCRKLRKYARQCFDIKFARTGHHDDKQGPFYLSSFGPIVEQHKYIYLGVHECAEASSYTVEYRGYWRSAVESNPFLPS